MITATFKGANGSLGYQKGKTYNLLFASNGRSYVVSRSNGTGYCPYQSLKAFFNNWENVTMPN